MNIHTPAIISYLEEKRIELEKQKPIYSQQTQFQFNLIESMLIRLEQWKDDLRLSDNEIAQPMEWRYKNCIIAERYNPHYDKFKHRHPHPHSSKEPIYGIHTTDEFGSRFDSFYYSKKEKNFILLSSPSNRTDTEILETSFTFTEAIEMIDKIRQGE